MQTLPGGPLVRIGDVTLTYDALGRTLTSIDTVRNLSHSFSYPQDTPVNTEDEAGVGSGTDLVTTTVAVGPDGLEVSRASTVTGGNPLLRNATARDAAKRLTGATLDTNGDANPDLYSGHEFDAAGHLVKQCGPATGAGSGYLATAASTTAYTYSTTSGLKTAENPQLQSVGPQAQQAGLITSSYTYTEAGRLATATTGGVTETYTFDSAGKLTGITSTGGPATTLNYSENRMSSMTTGTETTTFSFDTGDAGKLWRNQQGPSLNPDEILFSYTGTGRLATYDNETSGVAADYFYDAHPF